LDGLRGGCPTTLPATPTARLDGAKTRLHIMLRAEQIVGPGMGKFYQMLNDEQKANMNALTARAHRPKQPAVPADQIANKTWRRYAAIRHPVLEKCPSIKFTG
jgi:hypothetical protein